jgi:hypothetical protein
MAISVAIAVVGFLSIRSFLSISMRIAWPFPANGSAGRAALMTIGFSKSFGIAQATPCYEVVRRLTLSRKTTGLGRPVSFSGNCVRGAQWARIGPFDWGQGWLARSPVPRRVWNLRRGIRRRGGLRRRLLVRSILPSGAPQSNCEGSWPARGAASNAKVQVDRRIPDKSDWGARPGEVTANGSVSILLGGMVSVKGKTRSHLNFESRPDGFMVVASFDGGLQKCSGMPNVLPYMVPVKS